MPHAIQDISTQSSKGMVENPSRVTVLGSGRSVWRRAGFLVILGCEPLLNVLEVNKNFFLKLSIKFPSNALNTFTLILETGKRKCILINNLNKIAF